MAGEFPFPEDSNDTEHEVFNRMLGIEQRFDYHLESLDIECRQLVAAVDAYVKEQGLKSYRDTTDKELDDLFSFIDQSSRELSIKPGIELEASGQTLYILEDSGRAMHHVLSSMSVIQDKPQAITILPIPTHQALLNRIADPIARPGERIEDMYEFGICLALKGQIITADQELIESNPESRDILIPLNYPDVHLSRIVRATQQ